MSLNIIYIILLFIQIISININCCVDKLINSHENNCLRSYYYVPFPVFQMPLTAFRVVDEGTTRVETGAKESTEASNSCANKRMAGAGENEVFAMLDYFYASVGRARDDDSCRAR